MQKLPILISIPHGGTRVPEEIEDRITIPPKDLFDDGDAFTREIYGIREDVLALVETDIARAFVDPNRDPSDLPPGNPDGVVKTQTCHGKPIFAPGMEINGGLKDHLLDKYYQPYHQKIRRSLASFPEIKIALDCHSMEPAGPVLAPDPGKERPQICLGTHSGKSCPRELALKLSECFRRGFGLEASDITLDRPFSGGFITRHYGAVGSVPWVQVEINRKLYLSAPWFDRQSLKMDPQRIQTLQDHFRRTLACIFDASIL